LSGLGLEPGLLSASSPASKQTRQRFRISERSSRLVQAVWQCHSTRANQAGNAAAACANRTPPRPRRPHPRPQRERRPPRARPPPRVARHRLVRCAAGHGRIGFDGGRPKYFLRGSWHLHDRDFSVRDSLHLTHAHKSTRALMISLHACKLRAIRLLIMIELC
jgi:hypothetical protein